MMKYLHMLLSSGHTIFSYDILELILSISNKNTLKSIVASLLKSKIFIALYPGYRGFHNYNALEFASKLKSPSYISCETVLQHHAVIFQDYSKKTTLLRTNTVSLDIDQHHYHFRKIKDNLLLNPLGIIKYPNYAIASKERAICDMLYFVSDYYFDNIGSVDNKLLQQLATFYPLVVQKRLLEFTQ